MRIVAIIVALLATAAGITSVLAVEESWLGVWKLNVGKSPPSPNIYQAQVITLTSEDGMVAFAEDNITAKGMKYRVTCKFVLDGKDYPMTGSIAGIEFFSGRRLSPETAEFKAKKKDGTVVRTYWMTHSSDGRMRITLMWSGAEISGPPARVVVHERQ